MPEPDEVWLASHWTRLLILLFILSFGVRLAFLQIAPNGTTDAASRYHNAVLWLHNPTHFPPGTSSDAWLPLHFWLLGSVLWLSESEILARIFTALLGSLTVLLCASIFSRIWNRRVGIASALAVALFGFHIAFSITTSVEAPTIFFLALGIYGWVRYASESGWLWLLISGTALSAACLCRFEPWLVAPVAGFMMLDFADGRSSLVSNRNGWRSALLFAGFGSAASIAWLIFSFLKWGDPLALPHRTMWLNAHFRPAVLHHSMAFRVLTVPGSLLISLGPLFAALACLGLIAAVIARGHVTGRGLALVTLVLFAFNWWSSIRYETTQARYTLLYSWLLIPFAYDALYWISKRWQWSKSKPAFTATTVFFVLWQVGIVLGAKYAPPAIADRLGVMSPTIPLHHEMQQLTDWLKRNVGTGDVTVLDDFNWESPGIAKFGKLAPERTFEINAKDYASSEFLKSELGDFVRMRRPKLLVCSPYGPIGKMWNVDTSQHLEVKDLRFSLDLKWQSEHWRIYTISFLPSDSPASAIP